MSRALYWQLKLEQQGGLNIVLSPTTNTTLQEILSRVTRMQENFRRLVFCGPSGEL